MKFRNVIVVVFFLLICKSLFSITPPIICQRKMPYDSAAVNISCDRFELSELKFYRAKIDAENYTDFRKNMPAEDSCVVPGKYLYILEVPCPECGSGGYSSCMNYLEVTVNDHSEICEASGEVADIDSTDFSSYKSEWDYYEDCCESEFSADRLEIDFGKVKAGSKSIVETINLQVYSCSCAPNDLTPSFLFKNENQNVFDVEVGETNYSYIPSGAGEAEFLFSFSPESEKEYFETVIFDFDSIKIEVILKGQGVKEGEISDLDQEIPDEKTDDVVKADDSSQETSDPEHIPDASNADNEVYDDNYQYEECGGGFGSCSVILI